MALSRSRRIACTWGLFDKPGALVWLAALFSLSACERDTAPAQHDTSPPTVVVAEATQGSVPVLIETIGRTAAVNSVEVRARVSGVIEERAFVEGADVKKDDALFVIDQRPLQAALKQFQANLAESQASSAASTGSKISEFLIRTASLDG